MSLTAQERAEKIVAFAKECAPLDFAWSYEFVAAQIAEAEREAVIKLFEGDDCKVAQLEHAAFEKGRAQALEEAAKVLEMRLLADHTHDGKLKCSKDAAKVVRALAKEEL